MTASISRPIDIGTRSRSDVDVVVVGAGPYGLSIASYLMARGVDFRIFGSPMRFWCDMLKGSALKTFDFATNIYTPKRGYRFVDYCRDRSIALEEPIPMSVFADYGMWTQRELVPQVEDVEVVMIAPSDTGYSVELASGARVSARRVVVAIGVGCFQYVPQELAHLPKHLVTHTFARRDYGQLKGKDVTVIGGGQSAIEAAAFLHESGANTQMLVRESHLSFSDKTEKHRPLAQRLRYPASVAGIGWRGVALQYMRQYFHYVPEARRVRFTKLSAHPFGTWWLKDKIEGKVDVRAQTVVERARLDGERIVLSVRTPTEAREIVTDHIIAGTGYRFDLRRVHFLAREIVERIEMLEEMPRLSINFESSSKGLYFAGPIAALSFGPLVRFVAGAAFAAPTLARHIARST